MSKGKTIQIVSEDSCTGCGACYNKCPVNAIIMLKNREGFLFPNINEEKCIQCGLCINTCPEIKEVPLHKEEKQIYAFIYSEEIRNISSSGGAFTLLADYILDMNGSVCGAAFAENYNMVQHIIVSKKEDLGLIRGSKYLQSDKGLIYRKIKKLLDADKWVLFTGTPCENVGLKNYLNKDYEKLLLVDIICHGVPSSEVYHSYLEEISKGKEIIKVDFREKKYWGWGTASSIFFKDGTVYRKDCNQDFYWKAFLDGISTRKSCSICSYANPYLRGGDITIGDFWGIDEIDPEFNDNKGVSLLMINSAKGEKLLKQLFEKTEVVEKGKLVKENWKDVIELSKRRNGQFLAPKQQHWARKRFFELFEYRGFIRAYDEAVHSKYDIGIVGWWNNENYGGILTYYALHQILVNMGLTVLMIRHIRWKTEIEPREESISYRFAKKHYQISKNYKKEELDILNNHCNVFLSGSDQLFNPYLWECSGSEYFLGFVDTNKNIISYASSFGNSYDESNPYHMNISYWLHRFNALSVREDYAVDICKSAFGIEAKFVLDPVFLCDKKEYEKLIEQVSIKVENPYLLNFILDPDLEKKKLILEISAGLKLDYINLIDAVDFEKNSRMLDLENIKSNIDVEEWLFYYKNAEFIITDSYHGTCFAIIFQKPFISIANKKRGENRFLSILKLLGLMDRLVYDIESVIDRPELFQPIDYIKVYEKLNPKVQESLDWLKTVIFHPNSAAKDIFKLIDYYIRRMIEP